MTAALKPYDVVALTADQPALRLVRGQVGVIVEQLDPDTFEVEFADDHGRTYATAAIKADHLIRLRYAPPKVA